VKGPGPSASASNALGRSVRGRRRTTVVAKLSSLSKVSVSTTTMSVIYPSQLSRLTSCGR